MHNLICVFTARSTLYKFPSSEQMKFSDLTLAGHSREYFVQLNVLLEGQPPSYNSESHLSRFSLRALSKRDF